MFPTSSKTNGKGIRFSKPKKNVYNQYSREDLEKAIKGVKDGRETCLGASKSFGIPRKTLSDHVAGRSSLYRRAGRARNIPATVENAVVDTVIAAARAGFPLTKRQSLLKVGALVKSLGLKTQFKDAIPGKDYWQGTKKRRPDLVIRTPQICASNRLHVMTRTVINKYFDDLEKLLNELDLAQKSSQIWNCDETGLQFSPDASKVIAQKGVRSVVARCSPSNESVTTLVCINAAGTTGTAMPPLCVVKGKTTRAVQSSATHDAPEGTVWTQQANAWMNGDIGVQWFTKVFIKNCGEARPQLLILDSHHSHEVLEMLELAEKERIRILALPPHTTHKLQPLDRVVFKPMKTAYKRHCTEFLAANPDKTINKLTWPGLLRQTWAATMRQEPLQTCFCATGIYPLDRTKIPESAYLLSDAMRSIAVTQSEDCSMNTGQEQEQEQQVEKDVE
ncbi:hypothetical protein RRG08_049133 [Elysia crispata]|uniref:DDE-1 domain-containing protein n=1 Tax=Elysia crispata TaxID=231223 RepID=A0AAE0ZJA8_9GAST|nr:hypothetical protein RRG08_049133 [Elysia crispata]